MGFDMKGSSQATSCKPRVLGVFLWVREGIMHCGMHSFVCFSHLNKHKYSYCKKKRREEWSGSYCKIVFAGKVVFFSIA